MQNGAVKMDCSVFVFVVYFVFCNYTLFSVL